MRKKISAFIFIALILGSTFSPIFGVGKAGAQVVEIITGVIGSQVSDHNMSNYFLPNANEEGAEDEYVINPNHLSVSQDSTFTPTAHQNRLLVKFNFSHVDELDAFPVDGPPADGVFTSTDSPGNVWDSLIDNNLENSSANGIFLEIATGVNQTAIITEGNSGFANALTPKVTNWNLIDPADPTKPSPIFTKDGGKNIGYFIWKKNPAEFFNGTGTLTAAIPITGLLPSTQYYARVHLSEDGAQDDVYTQYIMFTTAPEGTADATNEVLDAGATSTANQQIQEELFGELIECDALNFYTWGGCFVYFFYIIFYHLSHFLLQMAGLLFDFFIGFSLSSKVYGQATFIYDGWKIVRDISNIFFIFILMYAAIGMILKLHHFDAKKIIAKVIIIGLLINFSLFFTRVVIDASNVLARVFYNEINISNTENLSVADPEKTGLATKGLSSGIVEGMNIANIISTPENFNKIKESGKIGAGTMFLVIIIGFIVNLITAWTFVTVCMYFIGRILGLWFAMIFSPLAFVTNIVPGLGSKLPKVGWSEWVSNLTNLAIMAPLFVFFMYLIMAFLKSKFIESMLLSNHANFSLPEFLVSILLQFMLIIGLIQSAKGLAKKLSGEFGDAVASVAKGVAGAAGLVAGGAVGLAAGGVAALGARTMGARSAAYLGSAEGKTMKLAAAGDLKTIAALKATGKYKGWDEQKIQKMAESKIKAKQKMASASFDLRNTGLANTISKTTGMDMNAIAKVPGMKAFGVERTTGGFQGEVDRRAAKRKKFFDSLSLSEDDKKALESQVKSAKEESDNAKKPFESKIAALERENNQIIQRTQANNGKATTADTAALAKNQKEINDLHKEVKNVTDAFKTGTTYTDATGKKHNEAGLNIANLEKDYKEASKGAFRKYSEFVKDNHIHDATSRGAFTADSVRKAFSRSVGEGFRQMGKNTGAAIKEGLAGAYLGTLVAGPAGTIVGGLAASLNALHGGGVARGSGRLVDMGIEKSATHNIEHGHAHEPHVKVIYKSPNVKIFNMFKGLSLGDGGDGGHNDHGGGHDDHGGGHH